MAWPGQKGSWCLKAEEWWHTLWTSNKGRVTSWGVSWPFRCTCSFPPTLVTPHLMEGNTQSLLPLENSSSNTKIRLELFGPLWNRHFSSHACQSGYLLVALTSRACSLLTFHSNCARLSSIHTRGIQLPRPHCNLSENDASDISNPRIILDRIASTISISSLNTNRR